MKDYAVPNVNSAEVGKGEQTKYTEWEDSLPNHGTSINLMGYCTNLKTHTVKIFIEMAMNFTSELLL
jgi:hypothetical protein